MRSILLAASIIAFAACGQDGSERRAWSPPPGDTNKWIVIVGKTKSEQSITTATNGSVAARDHAAQKKREPLAVFGDFALATNVWVNEEYGAVIVGGVVNRSDRRYKAVVLTITLFRGDIAVGNAYAMQGDLEAHGRWIFKAPVLESSANSYRVTSITGIPETRARW